MALVQGAVHGERPDEIDAELVSASSSGKQEPMQEGITSAGRASFAIANHDDISFDMENQSRASRVSQAEFANLVSESLAR